MRRIILHAFLNAVDLLAKAHNVALFCLSLRIGAFHHLFEDFDFGVLVPQLSLQVLQRRLRQLSQLDLSLEELLAVFISQAGLTTDLCFQVFNFTVFLTTLLLQLMKAMVFALQ